MRWLRVARFVLAVALPVAACTQSPPDADETVILVVCPPTG